jgi:hypothetical protein
LFFFTDTFRNFKENENKRKILKKHEETGRNRIDRVFYSILRLRGQD